MFHYWSSVGILLLASLSMDPALAQSPGPPPQPPLACMISSDPPELQPPIDAACKASLCLQQYKFNLVALIWCLAS